MPKSKTTPAGSNDAHFEVVHPRAAGIDIGDKVHYVALPEHCDPEVRRFDTYTQDLHALAAWLKQHDITTVAMESTGVYWKPLYLVLIREGLDVLLCHPRETRQPSGRKTDKSDARWIQKLHSCGLLSPSFLPDADEEHLRTLVRLRRHWIDERSDYVRRIQKSLELMNFKYHTLVRDTMGKTGTALLEAIVDGEQDASRLLSLVDGRIKAERSQLAKALEGIAGPEHMFCLKSYWQMYGSLTLQIEACDQQIEQFLTTLCPAVEQVEAAITAGKQEARAQKKSSRDSSGRRRKKSDPGFDVPGMLKVILGVDVTAVPGLSANCALEIVSEVGFSLRKWASAAHFRSWLNLCPNNKVSGDKLLSSRVLASKSNRATQAFRHAGAGVQKMDVPLGAYFRKQKGKGGHKYACQATGAKLATIFYTMVTQKVEYDPQLLAESQHNSLNNTIARLEKKLQRLKNKAA